MAVKNYGIHDKWTDLDKLNNVDIKSVDGVIESVKINGEEAGGGGGSSDFSTARGTLHTSISNQAVVISSAVVLNENDPSNPLVPFIEHDWYDGDTFDFVLYNGTCTVAIMPSGYNITNISATGGAEVGDFGITITGDFTINVTLGDPI